MKRGEWLTPSRERLLVGWSTVVFGLSGLIALGVCDCNSYVEGIVFIAVSLVFALLCRLNRWECLVPSVFGLFALYLVGWDSFGKCAAFVVYAGALLFLYSNWREELLELILWIFGIAVPTIYLGDKVRTLIGRAGRAVLQLFQ